MGLAICNCNCNKDGWLAACAAVDYRRSLAQARPSPIANRPQLTKLLHKGPYNRVSMRAAFAGIGFLLLLSGARAQSPAPDGAYTVGNGVSSPKVLTSVPPGMPDLAMKLRAAGDALLSFVVQADRTIRDIQVVRSVGYGMDEEAVRTVKKWRFAPGAKDGVPVDVRIRAEVDFREAPDPHAWGAGPMLFDLPAGSKIPKLESGSIPKPVRDAGNETVVLQFTLNSSGETRDIRPLQGSESTSLQALARDLSTWKFELSPDVATPVAGRVLLIKGGDQFRYEVSEAFRDPSGVRPVVPPARALPATGQASPTSQIISVPVRLRLEGDEAAKLLVERVPAQYPDVAKRAGVQGNVLLAITIAKDGSVKEVRAIEGPPELVPAAIEAVKQWKYQPAVSRGRTWEAATEVEIQFKLPE
jgi:TonB family protein